MDPRLLMRLYYRGKTFYGWHRYKAATAKHATLLLHPRQYEKLYDPSVVTIVIVTGDVKDQL